MGLPATTLPGSRAAVAPSAAPHLHAAARRCIDTLVASGRAADRHVALEGAAAHADADAARIEQVISHLLDNALKYTSADGRVAVRTEVDGGDAVLRVEDDGAGIDPELRPRIFDLFVQAPQALDRARGGLGLGLAVVKRLVDLHGGSVTAASAGAGRGSAFTVRLPAVPAPAAAPPAGAEPAAPTGPGRRILVVEDNADAREMLQALLEASGRVVAAAEDGPSGLAALRSFRPEIAVIDVGLPGIDGYDVARAARGDPETRQVRLVAGFDRHMTKPVGPAALRALLASL